MDARQYKDYVLVLLFVKYVSDKYAGQPFASITIPPGASFADMVARKGTKDIGDDINKKILGPLAKANNLSDMPDFIDTTKLGDGKEKVDRLPKQPPSATRKAIGSTACRLSECCAVVAVIETLDRPATSMTWARIHGVSTESHWTSAENSQTKKCHDSTR